MGPDKPSSQAVREQLEKILASPVFVNAERLRNFLRFTVEQALEAAAAPKEYTIGVEVFGRDASYDPRIDPVVRVEARRLRYKLKEYYDTTGRDDRIEITLPKGGYAPAFRERVSPPPSGEPSTARRFRNWRAPAVIAGAVAVLGAAIWASWPRPDSAWQFSIAVLPLENLSAEAEQEYFADGMTDALITDLAKITALRVISRTSVLQFKRSKQPISKIAGVLGVDYVVEGTILAAGGRVRITAQLIATPQERHLWAETYERDRSDVLALQREIAREIAAQIRVRLTPQDQARLTRPRPISPDVLQTYWMGRYYWNKRTPDDLRKSLEYFRQAIAKDPDSALAWAGLADAHNLLGSYYVVPMKESHPQARAAAETALKFDDSLAEAHASLATVIADYYWDWPLADRHFRRAIELNPNYATAHQWYAEYLSHVGRHEEALAEVNKAVELDPLVPLLRGIRGHVLYHSRKYDDAIQEMRRVVEMDPGAWMPRRLLGLAYIQKKMYSEAVSQLKAGLDAGGNPPGLVAVLAYAQAMSGQREEAERILRELLARGDVTPSMLTYPFLALRGSEQTLTLLEKAYDEHEFLMALLKVAPELDPLRREPRFVNLLKKLNLDK